MACLGRTIVSGRMGSEARCPDPRSGALVSLLELVGKSSVLVGGPQAAGGVDGSAACCVTVGKGG